MRLESEDIAAGIRTVCDLHAYLAELKLKATELGERVLPGVERGYFTADEDDAARGLLVSYWQARNALFDLIISFRQRASDIVDPQPGEFLIPFAAGLILVDAARFLRDVAERSPVIRRKMNEPAPNFGIPGGVYDTVQRPLISSRHAWQMYYAWQYFLQNEAELEAAASQTELARVYEVINALRGSVEVSLSEYANVRLRTRADQWLRGFGRNTIVRAIYAVQKLASGMMADVYVRPGHRPGVPQDVATALQAFLSPGDVLLVRKEFALTNYFLPGHWPHVALFLGDQQSLQTCSVGAFPPAVNRWRRLLSSGSGTSAACVLESMKDGVHVRLLASPLASDSIVVIRPQLSMSEVATALKRGLRHAGKPYDFDFDFRRSDRLVCTEVVYRAYEGVGPIRFPLVPRMGRPTLSGLDLVQMSLAGQWFTPVAVYGTRDKDRIVTGAEAASAIQELLSPVDS